MKTLSIGFILSIIGQNALAQITYNIDQTHSRISFSVAHMVVSEVEGNFKQFEGTVVALSDDFDGAEVEFTAQTASLDTDNAKRDSHLLSTDFFEVKKFPIISFKGKLVRDKKTYQLRGHLTMKGVTRQVSFDASYNGSIDTGMGLKAGFTLNGVLNRQDYGLEWSKELASGELAVGDEVKIRCVIELNKA